jgi:DNA repair ATPase RecN
MTNEERANLAGRLRVSLAHHTAAPSVVFAGSKDITQAADQIEADGQRIAELEAEIARLREALNWYEKQANDCRKITREGDDARYALDRDGGERARAALGSAEG